MQAIHGRGLGAVILSILLASCLSPRMGSEVAPERGRADAHLDPLADGGGATSRPDTAGSPDGDPQPGAPDAGPGAEAGPPPPEPPPGTDDGGLPPGACTPGDKRYGPASFPETCSPSGVWVLEAQPCPFVCQGPGVCAGECQPGARKCGDPPGALTPYLCDDSGRWRAEAPCKNLCSSGSCAGSCMPTTSRCDGTRRQMCSGEGTWETIETCPFVCSGGGQCTGECKPDSRSCSGSTPRTCDQTGRWVSGTTCQAPQWGSARCQDGACATTCANGTCGGGCCQCNDNGDCGGDTPACVNGRCLASTIQDVEYAVVGRPLGNVQVCTNANPPEGCPRRTIAVEKCNRQSGRCTIRMAWSGDFGGNGELGPDPCPYIIKSALDVRYRCSHNGAWKSATPKDFEAPSGAGCGIGLLGTATLSCP